MTFFFSVPNQARDSYVFSPSRSSQIFQRQPKVLGSNVDNVWGEYYGVFYFGHVDYVRVGHDTFHKKDGRVPHVKLLLPV